MTRIAQALTATALIAGLTATLPAHAQDKPVFKPPLAQDTPIFRGTFKKGKQPAADVPVTIVPGGAENDLIDVGRTSAAGTLTLDLAIGGLRPGKPMTVTQRECDSGTSLFLGDPPPEEKRCKDRKLGAFPWGDGDYTFSLDAGGANWWLWGSILGATGTAVAIPAFRDGDGSGGGGQTPGNQPGGGTGGGGTGGGGTGGGGTTPAISSLNGNYRGVFTLISDSCKFFVPSFDGTLNINATDSGSLTARLIEQLTFVYTGTMQITSAGNGSGSGTASGTLPGNVAYNGQLTFTIANNRASAEERFTLPGMNNCVGIFRADALLLF